MKLSEINLKNTSKELHAMTPTVIFISSKNSISAKWNAQLGNVITSLMAFCTITAKIFISVMK